MIQLFSKLHSSVVSNDFNLGGAEVSIIKALGFGTSDMSGASLIQRVSEVGEAELIDTMHSLIMMGYVISDKAAFRTTDEFKVANFHINSGYQRDLKEALHPQEKPKQRRVRRD